MFDFRILFLRGHAVDLVFHVSKYNNQIYILTWKFLVVVLYVNIKASCALDLVCRSFFVIKGVYEAKRPLVTQMEILQMEQISSVLFGLSVYSLCWVSKE